MSRSPVPEFGEYDGYTESFDDYTFAASATFRIRCTPHELSRFTELPRIRRIELVGSAGDRFDAQGAIEIWFIGGDPSGIGGSYSARAVATFETPIPRLSAFPGLTYLALRKDSLVETDLIPEICCRTIVIDSVNWTRAGVHTTTPVLEFKNRIIQTVIVRDESASRLTLRFADMCNPNITVHSGPHCAVTIKSNRELRNVKIAPNWDLRLPDPDGGEQFWDRNVDRIPVNVLARTARLTLVCVHLVNSEIAASDLYTEYSTIPRCRLIVHDAQIFRCSGIAVYGADIVLDDNLQIAGGRVIG